MGCFGRLLKERRRPWRRLRQPPIQPLGLFLIMHAFSAGCTALTGIEAISNGVPAFKPAEWVNARKTLIIMAILMAFLFAGQYRPDSVLWGGGRSRMKPFCLPWPARLLGIGPAYYLVQFATLAVLAVAANTSFAGFPRVAAILAQDKFMPRQLFNVGDRLVFHNGILLLSALTAVLDRCFQRRFACPGAAVCGRRVSPLSPFRRRAW